MQMKTKSRAIIIDEWIVEACCPKWFSAGGKIQDQFKFQ